MKNTINEMQKSINAKLKLFGESNNTTFKFFGTSKEDGTTLLYKSSKKNLTLYIKADPRRVKNLEAGLIY